MRDLGFDVDTLWECAKRQKETDGKGDREDALHPVAQRFRLFLRRVVTALGQGVQSPMPQSCPCGGDTARALPPQLFPCGCPFPAAFRAGDIPKSARRRARWGR
eukprot:4408304-Amphidinium_carterae.1